MAHYAILNDNNIVVQVIPGKDETDKSQDWEQHYGEFFGKVCKRTSYNTYAGKHKDGRRKPFRKNYAGIGYLYDEERDAFISPKPFESWTLDSNFDWQPPIVKPTTPDDALYDVLWEEDNERWIAQGCDFSITTKIWDPNTSSWS